MKKILITAILGLSFCSGDGLYRDVQGIVKSADPNSLTVPDNPTPSITIMGRNADDFNVEFIVGTLNTSVANFIIRSVPTKQPVVFKMTASSFDPIISFPFDLAKTASVTLPALPSGTTANIITQIEAILGQSVTSTSGMILGQLNSQGSSAGSCSPITKVQIKNKETNQAVSVAGPYYFNSSGNVVNTGQFSDTQCNYVMANVLPGSYNLQFFDNSLAQIKEIEVVVLPGSLSFGMDVP